MEATRGDAKEKEKRLPQYEKKLRDCEVRTASSDLSLAQDLHRVFHCLLLLHLLLLLTTSQDLTSFSAHLDLQTAIRRANEALDEIRAGLDDIRKEAQAVTAANTQKSAELRKRKQELRAAQVCVTDSVS